MVYVVLNRTYGSYWFDLNYYSYDNYDYYYTSFMAKWLACSAICLLRWSYEMEGELAQNMVQVYVLIFFSNVTAKGCLR